MRILMLSQWFDPEPTFKGLVFARELVAAGHDVEVITGFPNYPGGKIYPGYKQKLWQREEIDGVNIIRVPLYPSHDKSAIKRVLNYISFAFTATLYGALGAKRADVIYVYHPPITVGIAGSIIGFLRRVPFVYDIQDLWPDTLRATGMIQKDWLLKLISRICDFVYRRATHLVVLSNGFKKILEDRGIEDKDITVIYNWCDEESILAVGQEETPQMPEGFNILFAGNMGPAQALESVLDAAAEVLDSADTINFIFLGEGIVTEQLKSIKTARGLSNVHFYPRVPVSQVGGFLQAADALLVHLKKDRLFQITIPSKTQAYMAKGKPILMGVDGEASELVAASNAGVVCISEDSGSIATNARVLASMSKAELDEMGVNAKNFYNNNMALNIGVNRFIKVFEQVIKR